MNAIAHEYEGQIVDLTNERIFSGAIRVEDGRIKEVIERHVSAKRLLAPGLYDAHGHPESPEMSLPEYGRKALARGTVGLMADPHEIANVNGTAGVDYMVRNAALTPMHIHFGVPSCVPATSFETSGARFDADVVRSYIVRDEFTHLAEMMNFPGVINGDSVFLEMIAAANSVGKRVDGHFPMGRGEALRKYCAAGITSDHESVSLDEALEKISLGMKIIIREGSAAKNYAALSELIRLHPDKVMFCTDDAHPNDLVNGHIDAIVRRAIQDGHEPLKVLRASSFNVGEHYGLKQIGLLRVGDPADFIVVDDLQGFNVEQTYIGGRLVAEHGESKLPFLVPELINNFNRTSIALNDIRVADRGGDIKVIVAQDGKLITDQTQVSPRVVDGQLVSDPSRDILKIVVISRYADTKPAVGFIKNFGLQHGAIASSVAHDSHNVVVVGVSDEDILHAANLVIDAKGGLSAASGPEKLILEFPIAGLMSDRPGEEVAKLYSTLDYTAKEWGSTLGAPYMTLSFMALPVIPQLKITDKGLIDASTFEFVELQG